MKVDLEVKNREREIFKFVQKVAPGRAVELRVPPYAAAQCRAGKSHRRGIPPEVVEINGKTLITVIYDPGLRERFLPQGNSLIFEVFAQIGKLMPGMLERK